MGKGKHFNTKWHDSLTHNNFKQKDFCFPTPEKNVFQKKPKRFKLCQTNQKSKNTLNSGKTHSTVPKPA